MLFSGILLLNRAEGKEIAKLLFKQSKSWDQNISKPKKLETKKAAKLQAEKICDQKVA